jgi:predicted nucleic acid-binding protein
VIFVDSNVPMYLVGAEHPNKRRAQVLLERVVVQRRRLVTDAEVLQEVLHRFHAIRRPEAIGPTLEILLRYVDVVLPVTGDDVLAAKDVLLSTPGLSSRDALHVAVMQRHEVTSILSFDSGFDRVDGITRIHQ